MLATLNNNSQNDCWLNNNILNKILGYLYRASDISRSRGPAKYCEICQKYFQIHVDKTYLILILAIISVLFTPNVQIYLETSSLQRVNNVPKLPGVFRWNVLKLPGVFRWNQPIFLRILTFFPRKSREIGRFFREFSAENPAKFCFFFPQNVRRPVYIVHIMLIEIIKESIYTITFVRGFTYT